MNKQLLIWIVICLKSTSFVHAQWTEKDSLWLQQVLSGKDSLRLNPETMKAIREGIFIRPEEVQQELLSAPPVLSIIKDFTGVGVPDSVKEEVDPLTIPLAVYMRKQLLDSDSLPGIAAGAFTTNESFKDKNWQQIGKLPVSIKAGSQDLYMPEVKDGQRRGTVGASVRATFSLEDMLRYIFWPSERQKKKNRKRAEQLKYYYDQP